MVREEGRALSCIWTALDKQSQKQQLLKDLKWTLGSRKGVELWELVQWPGLEGLGILH